MLGRDAVTVWYDGACEDAERLGAAVALCARWAVDRVEGAGPYR
jgi:hypothetical protein